MNDPRSAFNDVTRCTRGCGATAAYPHPSAETERRVLRRAGLLADVQERDVAKDDAEFTEHLLQQGWIREVDSWVCPNHHIAEVMPNMIRCPHVFEDGLTCCSAMASSGPGYDDDTVMHLRRGGWQVVDGAWTCPQHLPEVRRGLPGAMGRPRNVHCSNCGDTRGGAYGHETDECTWADATSDKAEPAIGSVVLVSVRQGGSGRGSAYQRGAAGWYAVNVDALMSWAEMNAWAAVKVIHHA